MLLTFARDLPQPPEVVWQLVTEPAQMNRWSTAEIVGESATTRRVIVRTGPFRTTLHEEITEVDPPSRLVYHVVRGGGLRRHEGVQTLTAVEGGTRFTWTVEFASWMPEAAVAAILRPQMERSLDRLASLAAAQ